MFFKRKKKEKKEWKELQRVREMPEEEFLQCYKRLYVKSFLISGLGVGLFCLGIFFIIFLF